MPLDEALCPACPKCGGGRTVLTLRSTNGAYCLCGECGHCWYHRRSEASATFASPPDDSVPR